MRKTILYAALLAAALMIPTRATELGKMKPVETVCVFWTGDMVVIETDTGNTGRGMTVAEAVENLKETTPGIIYLDTADYLLLEKGTEQLIPELAKYLKKSVRICNVQGDVAVKSAAEFLAVHAPSVKLGAWQCTMELEVLEVQNGQMILTGKN